MIKLKVLLVKGRIIDGRLYQPSQTTALHHLIRMYGLTTFDLIDKFGVGWHNKIKVRNVTREEDLRGIRLKDWIILEDVAHNNYAKLFNDKIEEYVSRIRLGGICE